MYKYYSVTGETKNADGLVVAPCQSADDPEFIKYNQWMMAGNQPEVIFEAQAPDKAEAIAALFDKPPMSLDLVFAEMNMLATALKIATTGGTRTQEEQAQLDSINTVWDQIKAIRNSSSL
jgi:hypothetical protein